MNVYEVTMANRATGREKTVTVEAKSRLKARRRVEGGEWLVGSIEAKHVSSTPRFPLGVVVLVVIVGATCTLAAGLAGAVWGYSLGVTEPAPPPASVELAPGDPGTIMWAACEEWLLNLHRRGKSREEACGNYGYMAAGGTGVGMTELRLYAERVWDDMAARGVIAP